MFLSAAAALPLFWSRAQDKNLKSRETGKFPVFSNAVYQGDDHI